MSSQKKNVFKALNALKILENLEKMENEEKKKRVRRMWVNPFLEKREKFNIEHNLLKDILWENGSDYQNFCRMDVTKFEEILTLIEPFIKKQSTPMREPVSPRVRLAIALRYIATGDSYRSLEFLTRVSRKTISQFVPEVLSAIYDVLQPSYLKIPKTENEWLNTAQEFYNLWDFPHVLGAIDGKHIRIKSPPKSGSDFFNYKGFYSIVLLAVVNAHSKFIYIDVGANGRVSDTCVYNSSYIYESLKTKKLNIPPKKELPGQILKTPYFFIGDDIFGLDENLMKGYNKNINLSTREEIFNYRLCRARMTVEMAFGRLTSRFRIFHRPIEVDLKTVDIIVKTCCVLHNYISEDMKCALPPDGENTPELPQTIASLGFQNQSQIYKYAKSIRDQISQYFITNGDVPYQWQKIKINK